MGRIRFNPTLLIATLLGLIPVSKSEITKPPQSFSEIPKPPQSFQPPQSFHPLCMSQFALANHACASIPYGPFPHSSSVSISTDPPPSSPVPLPGFNRFNHRHHHRRGHKHRQHRRRHHETEAAKECCHWLKAIDDICVCDLLLRLPLFLARPLHVYKVLVDDGCKIEYTCPGRLMTEV